MVFRWLILFVLLYRSVLPAEEVVVVDILTNSTSLEEPTEEYTCDCNTDDLIQKGNYTLTVEVKNMQVRLVEPFRDAIAFTTGEKKHLLDFIRFVTLREVRSTYPLLLNYTDFLNSFDEMIGTFRNILTTENAISLTGIKYEVSTAVQKFLSAILPDMFLCLSVGKCRTVPLDYHNCMMASTKHWSVYLGNTPNKMAMTISEAIYRYRKVEFLLVDMHKQLMNAHNLTLSHECLQEYVHTLPCNCTMAGITPCHTSCSNSMEKCFGKFSREWAAKLHLMRNMTSTKKSFLDEFLSLKKTIFSVIRIFIERKSYVYAEHVFNSCGPLGEMIIHPSKHSVHFQSPGPFVSRGDGAVRELQLSAKTWDRLGRKICDHSGVVLNPTMCYDGTKVISIDHDLLPITKDVRPRPMMDWIEKKNEKKANVEGSASNPLWDDEDSEDFDGSGSGMPPVIDRNPVKAIIQEDHPKNIDLSTNPKGPSVIVTEKEIQPDGSTTSSILICVIIVAVIKLF
ncbi:LONg [Caenorhabditis elegans]|uniref:LONg n=1 Tax=Caenorhabditis elegans TaxID=6239 RepID=Q18530_CAEEL|nr:LONg [Caenorhabditis elegans]CCD67078.1 LONg [Caenorhabditis elegans]|eukprot:NP_508812.3 LONg [Caenorhabditis elegans]